MANGSRSDLHTAGSGTGADKLWGGGKAAFMVDATFSGGNVKLQIKLPTGNYGDVSGSTLSAAGMVLLDLPAGMYRAVATTATAVYASLVKVDT